MRIWSGSTSLAITRVKLASVLLSPESATFTLKEKLPASVGVPASLAPGVPLASSARPAGNVPTVDHV